MQPSTRRVLAVVVAAVALLTAGARPAADIRPVQDSIIFATTTSTQDTGLLDVLVPRFEKRSGIEVKVIAVGTGAALRMAATGDADVVLVHAPEAERVYVDSGDLVEGQRVMYNTFVLAGPPSDPAGVRQASSVVEAMKTIGARGVFISRGDDSGTHKKELELWTRAGVDPRSIKREETGQGMGATLNVADQRGAYVLTDKATYLALRKRLKLAILFEGGTELRNIYTIYVVNPTKHAKVKAAAARAFAAFWVSPEVQAMSDPDIDVIQYDGHSNLGRNIENSLRAAPELAGSKILSLGACATTDRAFLIRNKFQDPKRVQLINTYESTYFNWEVRDGKKYMNYSENLMLMFGLQESMSKLKAYKERGEARPAFIRALADQAADLGEPIKLGEVA